MMTFGLLLLHACTDARRAFNKSLHTHSAQALTASAMLVRTAGNH